MILGRDPKDWDIVVEGKAGPLVQELSRAFQARVVEYPRFLTFTLHFEDGTSLDVATARGESYPVPGRLPVVRPATLAEDPRRRDFTVNALYLMLNPAASPLFDPSGGLADLEAGIVRALHDKSFLDDPTRLYRAARYAGRYDWRVEERTLALIRAAARGKAPADVSPVRLRHELFHALLETDPLPGLRLLWDWGLWRFWDPGWKLTDDLTRRVKSAAPELEPRLAAFLGPDPGAAESWLKRVSCPTPLRRAVKKNLMG
jgi:tRNA nucleotidyltransferase (CCA-adding enzyme)